jgi:hypothetical protein
LINCLPFLALPSPQPTSGFLFSRNEVYDES